MKNLTPERIEFLVKNGLDLSIREVNKLLPQEKILALWGLDGYAILKYIDTLELTVYNFRDFIRNDCYMCSDYGQVILSGIRKKFPVVYEMIPEDMGICSLDCLFALAYVLKIRNLETYISLTTIYGID